jgi:hypothetical protein
MEGFFENFQYLKSELQNMNGQINSEQKFKKIVHALDKIYTGLKTCGKKMTSSAMFIDYFVHDILDFSILNKEGAIFTKDLNVCSIKETINQIITIQEDKAKMKNIEIKTHYKDFPEF